MRVPGPLTARAFASLPASLSETGAAGGSSLLDSLTAQDAALRRLHGGSWPPAEPPEFVRVLQTRRAASPAAVDVDVAVCGGTLGLILACALQLRGHSVAVVEAGPLRGRAQDWNTSADELQALVRAGVLDASELAAVAPLRFGPMACRFGPATPEQWELQLGGVLDVGVSPAALLRRVRTRFEAAGGLVLERTPIQGVALYEDGAALELGTQSVHARLVVDCMGHRSPIALQQRAGQRPDGVCVQVGSCARGPWVAQWGRRGDFFVTASDAVRGGPSGRAALQYFYQAFPSSGATDERSTYLFTYLRPGAEMPSLLEVMEDYWAALPAYQGIGTSGGEGGGSGEGGGGGGAGAGALSQVDVQRIVFGWFPTYRRGAPLPPRFDRVLSVGDASAVQSPISFGGFCAMLRHLPRYTRGLDLALREDRLSRADLARLTPYLPNLGTAWMSAAAMTARAVAPPPAGYPSSRAGYPPSPASAPGEGASLMAEPSYTLVNDLLEGNFKVMSGLPRAEALVFFRDVTTLRTLSAVLLGQTLTMAPLLPRVMAELVSPLELLEFSGHYAVLALYTLLHHAARAAQLRSPAAGYQLSCTLDALAYGSGLDGEEKV